LFLANEYKGQYAPHNMFIDCLRNTIRLGLNRFDYARNERLLSSASFKQTYHSFYWR